MKMKKLLKIIFIFLVVKVSRIFTLYQLNEPAENVGINYVDDVPEYDETGYSASSFVATNFSSFFHSQSNAQNAFNAQFETTGSGNALWSGGQENAVVQSSKTGFNINIECEFADCPHTIIINYRGNQVQSQNILTNSNLNRAATGFNIGIKCDYLDCPQTITFIFDNMQKQRNVSTESNSELSGSSAVQSSTAVDKNMQTIGNSISNTNAEIVGQKFINTNTGMSKNIENPTNNSNAAIDDQHSMKNQTGMSNTITVDKKISIESHTAVDSNLTAAKPTQTAENSSDLIVAKPTQPAGNLLVNEHIGVESSINAASGMINNLVKNSMGSGIPNCLISKMDKLMNTNIGLGSQNLLQNSNAAAMQNMNFSMHVANSLLHSFEHTFGSSLSSSSHINFNSSHSSNIAAPTNCYGYEKGIGTNMSLVNSISMNNGLKIENSSNINSTNGNATNMPNLTTTVSHKNETTIGNNNEFLKFLKNETMFGNNNTSIATVSLKNEMRIGNDNSSTASLKNETSTGMNMSTNISESMNKTLNIDNSTNFKLITENATTSSPTRKKRTTRQARLLTTTLRLTIKPYIGTCNRWKTMRPTTTPWTTTTTTPWTTTTTTRWTTTTIAPWTTAYIPPWTPPWTPAWNTPWIGPRPTLRAERYAWMLRAPLQREAPVQTEAPYVSKYSDAQVNAALRSLLKPRRRPRYFRSY